MSGTNCPGAAIFGADGDILGQAKCSPRETLPTEAACEAFECKWHGFNNYPSNGTPDGTCCLKVVRIDKGGTCRFYEEAKE